jgi:hypothetical protein
LSIKAGLTDEGLKKIWTSLTDLEKAYVLQISKQSSSSAIKAEAFISNTRESTKTVYKVGCRMPLS